MFWMNHRSWSKMERWRKNNFCSSSGLKWPKQNFTQVMYLSSCQPFLLHSPPSLDTCIYDMRSRSKYDLSHFFLSPAVNQWINMAHVCVNVLGMGKISQRPVAVTIRQKQSGRRQTTTAPITNTVVLSALFSLVNLSTSCWSNCWVLIFSCWRRVSRYNTK